MIITYFNIVLIIFLVLMMHNAITGNIQICRMLNLDATVINLDTTHQLDQTTRLV